MSIGMDDFGRKARCHPKVRSEGIFLRLLDLSVGNFLPLAMICFSARAGSARPNLFLSALHLFKMGQDVQYKTIEAVIPRRFFRIMGLLVSNFVRGISLAIINPTQGAISESRLKSIQ
jgi:hypothetical protein